MKNLFTEFKKLANNCIKKISPQLTSITLLDILFIVQLIINITDSNNHLR
jgi:hypothetical protein